MKPFFLCALFEKYHIFLFFFSALCINEDVEDEPEENDIISSESEQQVEIFAQNEEAEEEEEEPKNNGIEIEIEKKVDFEITNNEKHGGGEEVSKTNNELPSELNNVDHETSANKNQDEPITKTNNSMPISEEENLDPVAEKKDTNDKE